MIRTDDATRRSKTLGAGVALLAWLAVVLFGGVQSARADVVLAQHVYNTDGLGLYLHPDSPTLDSATSELMPDGTEFDLSCYAVGDDVLGDSAWDYGTDASTGASGYAADYYVDTPVTEGNEASQLDALGLPACGSSTPSGASDSTSSASPTGDGTYTPVSYDRYAAVQLARDNVDTPPSFPDDDCTWYVSQALWAGGLPQSDLWTGNSWNWSLQAARSHYPGPTVDAAQANDLVDYLVTTGIATRIPISWSDNTAANAQPGDIIAYHWNTGEPSDQIDHLAFVTDLNSDGYPDVSQHTPAVTRYWSWDPGGDGRPAGWIQNVDRPDGQDPGVWLIHINDRPTF
jgi:surface antigen